MPYIVKCINNCALIPCESLLCAQTLHETSVFLKSEHFALVQHLKYPIIKSLNGKKRDS